MSDLDASGEDLIASGLGTADELLFSDPELLLSEGLMMDTVNHAIPAMCFPQDSPGAQKK